jgi:hypothetical protein
MPRSLPIAVPPSRSGFARPIEGPAWKFSRSQIRVIPVSGRANANRHWRWAVHNDTLKIDLIDDGKALPNNL